VDASKARRTPEWAPGAAGESGVEVASDEAIIHWLRRVRNAAAAPPGTAPPRLDRTRLNALHVLRTVIHPVLSAFARIHTDAFPEWEVSVTPPRADFLDESYPSVALQMHGQPGTEQSFTVEMSVVLRAASWDLEGIVSTSAGNWPLDLDWWSDTATLHDDAWCGLVLSWRRYAYLAQGSTVPNVLPCVWRLSPETMGPAETDSERTRLQS
jgi:hypothetical protein